MPKKLKPIAQNQFLVTFEGLDAYWETFSGLSDEADSSEYTDGLSNRQMKLIGPRQIGEIDLTKPFDPESDKAIVDWFKTWCDGSSDPITVSVTPVRYCPDPEPIGPALSLFGCRPTKLEGFEADKKSSDVSEITLSFTVDDYAYN